MGMLTAPVTDTGATLYARAPQLKRKTNDVISGWTYVLELNFAIRDSARPVRVMSAKGKSSTDTLHIKYKKILPSDIQWNKKDTVGVSAAAAAHCVLCIHVCCVCLPRAAHAWQPLPLHDVWGPRRAFHLPCNVLSSSSPLPSTSSPPPLPLASCIPLLA